MNGLKLSQKRRDLEHQQPRGHGGGRGRFSALVSFPGAALVEKALPVNKSLLFSPRISPMVNDSNRIVSTSYQCSSSMGASNKERIMGQDQGKFLIF